MKFPALLCVDDEPDNLDALERVFRKKYTVHKATSGLAGLEILRSIKTLPVIISDQRMPTMNGVEFLAKSMEIHPNSVRILLTGYTDLDSVIAAVNSGQIYRYLNKPWDPVDLLSTVDRAAERYFLNLELQIKSQELERAYSELQSLDLAKSKFMILINHELRTPLTTVLSFAELLKESQLNDEQNLCVSRIQRSGERLKSIVEDVLLVMQGETKNLVLRPQRCSFSDLLMRIPSEITKALAFREQKILTDFRANEITADPQLILQVIGRLLHNAAKFGKESEAVHLKTQWSGSNVEFSILNSGPTIRPELVEKILSPFLLDEEVMNHSLGMGIGLTVCQTIVQAHRGQLHIKNFTGGVEVTFSLPQN